MALSGQLRTKIGTGGVYDLWLDWRVVSQSVADNRSTLSVALYAARTDGHPTLGAYNNYANNTVSLTAGGVACYDTSTAKLDLRTATGAQLAAWSGSFPHNADGSLTLALEGKFYFNSTAASSLPRGWYAVSGSAALDTIPRASTFTISGNQIGSPVIVSIRAASPSFTHNVVYQRTDGEQFVSASGVGEGDVPVLPHLNDCALLPDSDRGTAKIIVTTFQGGTQIGSPKEQAFTLHVPESVRPSVTSVAVTPVNDNPAVAGWGVYLQGCTKARIVTTAETAYGSPIKTWAVTGDGIAGSSADFTTGPLKKGAFTVSSVVTDERERPSESKQSAPFTVLPYEPPRLTPAPDWFRCDASGAAADDGTFLYVVPHCSVTSLDVPGGNAAVISLYAKKSTESDWTLIDDTLQNNVGKRVGAVTSAAGVTPETGPFDAGASYRLRFEVGDAVGKTDDSEDLVPTQKVAFHLRTGGRGAAFGKMAETDELLESAWRIKAKGLECTDKIVSRGTFNRGEWNAPAAGALTQMLDGGGGQHSVIVGVGENGVRYYGIDLLNGYTDLKMRIYAGDNYIEIRGNGDLHVAGELTTAKGKMTRTKSISIGATTQLTAELLNANLPWGSMYGGTTIVNVNGMYANVGSLIVNLIAADENTDAGYGKALYISLYTGLQIYTFEPSGWSFDKSL